MTKFFQTIHRLIAAVFGLGSFLPVGQGTAGAFAGLLCVPLFLTLSVVTQCVLIGIGIIVGVYASTSAEKQFGIHDDHRIIIDEFVSIFITFGGVAAGPSFLILAVGFFLNRVFDIWKPFPARRLQHFPGGWGIMLDDVASGVLAGLVLVIIRILF